GWEGAGEGVGGGVVGGVGGVANEGLDAGRREPLGVANRQVLGEFNWSSQPLTTEVLYGKATWVDGDADGAAGDAVAGPTAGAARCGAGVLREDCRRAVERGGGDRVWGISAGRGTLVPRAGWHAVDPAHPAVGEVSVVR